MLFTKLSVTMSLIGAVFAIRCYSGMQGSVNGDAIGEIEVLDCNGTDFCVKLPSTGHVGRKHYEGAQYSCDFGECRKEGCVKRGSGEICCCSTDECNGASYHGHQEILTVVFLITFTLFYMY